MKKALAHVPAPKAPARTPHSRRTQLAGALALLGVMAGLGVCASRPARTAGGPIAVNVANTPLAVSDPEAAQTPFQTEIVPTLEGSFIGPYYYLGQFTVPAGKRLVLRGLSANFAPGTLGTIPQTPVFAITTLAGSSAGVHNFTATVNQQNENFTTSNNPSAFPEQSMAVYADPGSTVSVRVDNLLYYQIYSLTITLSGYYVDVP